MTIYINQYQSISINRLILIMDDQSIAKICVVIEWYWLVFRSSISIDWKCRGKWVIQVHEQWGVFFALRRLGRNCVNRWTVFVWLLIDHRLTDTNQYQSIPINSFYQLILIDWLVFQSSISIDWKQREDILYLFFFSLLTLLILKLLFFADIITPWKYNTEP